MAPAVGVAVLDFGFAQQAAVFAQPVDDYRIGFPHTQAGHARHFADVAALGIDRIVELDAVFVADEIVFQTVRGRGVHQTGTGFGGNVLAVEHQDVAIQERMVQMQVFQSRAAGFGEHGAA